MWLQSCCDNKEDLKKVIDTAKHRVKNIRDFVLSSNWEDEKRRIYETYGILPNLFRAVGGPVTLAMSLYGVENLIYLIMDEPGLAAESRDIISEAIFEMAQLMDEESGYGEKDKTRWFQVL